MNRLPIYQDYQPTAAAVELLPSVRSRLPERPFVRPPGMPDDAALESSGAVIGEVRFVRLNVFDPSIRGQTDQFTLRFRKPA